MQEMESETDEGLLENKDNEKGPGRGRAAGGARGRGQARGQGRSQGSTSRRGRGQGSHGKRGRGEWLSKEAGAAENQANHEQQLVVRKLDC